MIANFDKQTASLNDYEMNILLPIMVKCLSKHVGKDRVISNSQMCLKMAFRYFNRTFNKNFVKSVDI